MAKPRIPAPRQSEENLGMAWHKRAACKGVSPEVFFPTNTEQQHHGAGAALEFCGRCPVRFDCLKFALDHNEEGTWGGLTGAERNRLRLRRSDFTAVAQLEERLTVDMPACVECGKHRKTAANDSGVCDFCAAARRRRADRPGCSHLDCGAVQYARALCKSHYKTEQKKGTFRRAETAS